MKNNSKIIKKTDSGWDGIPKKVYKTETLNFKNISRFSLLGESEHEHELNMQTRYFEIENGGYSSLEYHRHPHSVVIIKGKGSMVLGDEVHALNLHDVVYISPETLHQFHADADEPLGFICIVDRYRDKPSLPDDTMLDEVLGVDSDARRKVKK
jgi:quercetin dioxygenase-like cupin family protein